MTQLIRSQVFETNSSSSHSVSINTGELPLLFDTLYPDSTGELILDSNCFGWEWQKYNDAATKASYCAIYFQNYPEFLATLMLVLQEQTGASTIILPDKDSYIDHESVFILHHSLGILNNNNVNKEVIRNFIFSKNSWLFTGNDNEEAPRGFYKVPTYKETGCVAEKDYKYELIIEGLDTTYKIINRPEDKDIPFVIHNYLANTYDVDWDLYWTENKRRLDPGKRYSYNGELYDYKYDNKYTFIKEGCLSLINTRYLNQFSKEEKDKIIKDGDSLAVLTIKYEIKEL